MSKDKDEQIFTTPASLWDGSLQLSGSLELWDTKVIFRLTDFPKSHLHLCIPLSKIEKVEEFLVFDLAKNGLRIQDKNGRYDLFVLDGGGEIKNAILDKLHKSSD